MRKTSFVVVSVLSETAFFLAACFDGYRGSPPHQDYCIALAPFGEQVREMHCRQISPSVRRNIFKYTTNEPLNSMAFYCEPESDGSA